MVSAAVDARWIDFVVVVAMTAVYAYAAYTGWRHVGVIDSRVWKSYLWAFPLLAAMTLSLALLEAATWISERPALDHPEQFPGVFGLLWLSAVSIPGFVCVLCLRAGPLR